MFQLGYLGETKKEKVHWIRAIGTLFFGGGGAGGEVGRGSKEALIIQHCNQPMFYTTSPSSTNWAHYRCQQTNLPIVIGDRQCQKHHIQTDMDRRGWTPLFGS